MVVQSVTYDEKTAPGGESRKILHLYLAHIVIRPPFTPTVLLAELIQFWNASVQTVYFIKTVKTNTNYFAEQSETSPEKNW